MTQSTAVPKGNVAKEVQVSLHIYQRIYENFFPNTKYSRTQG